MAKEVTQDEFRKAVHDVIEAWHRRTELPLATALAMMEVAYREYKPFAITAEARGEVHDSTF